MDIPRARDEAFWVRCLQQSAQETALLKSKVVPEAHKGKKKTHCGFLQILILLLQADIIGAWHTKADLQQNVYIQPQKGKSGKGRYTPAKPNAPPGLAPNPAPPATKGRGTRNPPLGLGGKG